jgi:hypothetical protein
MTVAAPSSSFPVACAEEITAPDPVAEAITEARSGWVRNRDAKRLRIALLGVLALLD